MERRSKPFQSGFFRRVKGLRAAAVIVGVVGLMVLGAGFGQLLWPAHVTQQVVVSPTDGPSGGATPSSTEQFPHLVGLDEATARAAITSAGFTAAEIITTAKPAAGPEKFVIGQEPAPWSQAQPNLRKVTLTLSEQVQMPDLTGKPVEEARQLVTDLHGIAQIVRVVTADQPAGVVLSSDPPAGQPMPVGVTLNVSDGGESLSLSAIDSVDSSNCRPERDQSINGTVHAQAISCTPGSNERPAFIEFAIGRHATFLEGTLGMLDTAPVGLATIRIIGDGKVLSTHNLQFGTATPLRLDVRGVLRLRFEVVEPTDGDRPRVVLGDIRLVGNPDDLDQIGT